LHGGIVSSIGEAGGLTAAKQQKFIARKTEAAKLTPSVRIT
jgi:hypothetical protein